MASKQWQLARESAERYQRILSPTILGPVARALVDHLELHQGETVLDVGCGTGDGTRYAAECVGKRGAAVGVDVNEYMIDVARTVAHIEGAPITWRVADAGELPYEDGTFDVLLFAQAIQFLRDRPVALGEAGRVLRPGGRVGISVWCDAKRNPYFEALIAAIDRHIGATTAGGLHAAFQLSDRMVIEQLLERAGFTDVAIETKRLTLPLAPLADFVPRHISATPMDSGFRAASAAARAAVVDDVATALAQFGATIPFATHILTARSNGRAFSAHAGEEK